MRFQNLRTGRERKGITLLFVVSMIVLFMLLATTFLVVSAQYLRGAKSYSKSEIFEQEPHNELDQALFVLLRDTRDPKSPLRGTSLLADVYGYNKGFRGFIKSGTVSYVNNTSGNIVQFEVENAQYFIPQGDPLGRLDNVHVGRVLTVTSGPAKGMTGRIMTSQYRATSPTSGRTTFAVCFDRANNYGLVSQVSGGNFTTHLDEAALIVNGKPFQGKGANYSPGTNGNAIGDQALLPNRTGQTDSQFLNNFVGVGELNETYDAADYQNMFLSAEVPGTTGQYSVQVLPSLHRPQLVARSPNNARASMRPHVTNHPGFPQIHPVNGPWDVDNDNDGIKDSVWVDFNLPVMTDSSGRTYKRMFAVHVRDLDGKINLNAHSGAVHEDGVFAANLAMDRVAFIGNSQPGQATTTYSTDGGRTSHHPLGQGWGPPEVNLRTVVANNMDFVSLLYGSDLDGDSVKDVYGRNGYDNGAAVPRPGLESAIDPVVSQRFYDVPSAGFYFGNSFGAAWDIHGRFAAGHDLNGQPRFSLPTAIATERLNSEYERRIDSLVSVGHSSLAALDMPFTYAELERLVRGNDNDSLTLPSRLVDLAPNTFNRLHNSANRSNTLRNRLKVTTHSYSIPAPPTDLREYYSQILYNHILNSPTAPGSPAEDPTAFAAYHAGRRLPLGINLGTKMNLNFPFGNGQDDNNNGIVDESWGPVTPYLRDNPGALANVSESYLEEFLNGFRFDHDNDPSPDENGDTDAADRDAYLFRARFASQIYVMARIIFKQSGAQIDDTTVPDVNNDGTVTGHVDDDDDLAGWLAQWAINVVDFRDADSIMTPFEYDINPFNGWDVDGNPMTTGDGMNGGRNERRVVWGCERPELLLTESYAYHNRRVEDTDGDDNEEEKTTAAMDADNDFDQRLKPFGGLMLELWNPNKDQTAATRDIYQEVNGVFGVDLTRKSVYPGFDAATADNVDEQPSPVWRIVFTTSDFDLDNKQENNGPVEYDADDIERVCYFAPLDDFGNDITQLKYDLPFTPNSNNTFVPTKEVRDVLHPVGFQRTAVIGTGHYMNPNKTEYMTPLGRREDVDPANNLNLAQTRGFVLDAGRRRLTVRDFHGAGVRNYTRETEVIPIENLNISEPDNGYPLPAGFVLLKANYKDATYGDLNELVYFDGEGKFPDRPFDEQGSRFNRQNGNKNSYRYAHLQRLANPLLGWDPNSNPYRTVDTLPIDLQVFNGEDNGSGSAIADPPAAPGGGGGGPGGGPGGGGGGAGGGGGGGAGAEPYVGTRERGEVDAQAGNNRRLLWRHEPDTKLTQQASVSPGDRHFFSYHLEEQGQYHETLGETLLDTGYSTIINYSYDYLHHPTYAGNAVEFPSLAWNNRPFISQYELMLVPQTTSSQLLRRFSISQANDYGHDQLTGSYGHLLNFFQSSAGNPSAQQRAANLYRLFDYIHVPSRFTHTDSMLDPAVFSGDANGYGYRPPFNVIPKYREPGKVNLNTIYSAEVLNAVKGGNVNRGGYQNDITWPEFVAARRGEPGASIFQPTVEATYFANPFRAGDAGNTIHRGSPRHRNGVDATLLRSEDIDGGGAPTNSFFDADAAFDGNPSHAASRHPYIRYRNRVRLGNLTTTQSNCFAVWITVGYFEYDERTQRLGEELGSSAGEVERHRAFYMIDRSIPVGFEPGKNHNVDKTIMLRRYIE